MTAFLFSIHDVYNRVINTRYPLAFPSRSRSVLPIVLARCPRLVLIRLAYRIMLTAVVLIRTRLTITVYIQFSRLHTVYVDACTHVLCVPLKSQQYNVSTRKQM